MLQVIFEPAFQFISSQQHILDTSVDTKPYAKTIATHDYTPVTVQSKPHAETRLSSEAVAAGQV
jgi:hypothetical protein